jgi:hypothetical protein
MSGLGLLGGIELVRDRKTKTLFEACTGRPDFGESAITSADIGRTMTPYATATSHTPFQYIGSPVALIAP